MKRVLIIGATGMVGSLILKKCLNSPEVTNVISVVRKPSGVSHKKLTEIVHPDFTSYSDIERNFADIDIAFYCVGVYTGQVARDEFRRITVDYTEAFASQLKESSPNASFCFLSGAGADSSEKSRMMFAKDKGAAENILIGIDFPRLMLFRPGYIYPVKARKEPNFTYKLSRRMYPILKVLMPNGVITSDELAKAMLMAGISGNYKQILENKDIKSILVS